jgi:serine/threonine-protein kinase
MTEVAFRLMNEAPPDLAAKGLDLSPSLVATVHRALAKRPEDRFASAADMAADLRQVPQTTEDHTVVLPRARAEFDAETLSTIERKLAQQIGPIARHLVQSAARRAGSLEELHTILAQRTGGSAPAQPRSEIAPALVQRAERELARHVGPIARILVKRALDTTHSPDEFWQALATHIERDAERQAFIRARGE